MKAAILCGLIGTVSGESTRELFELRTRTAQVHSSPVSHGVVGSVLNKLFADQDQKIQTKIASISLTKKPTPSLLEMHATDTKCQGGIGVMIQSASKLPDKDWFFWGKSDPMVVARAWTHSGKDAAFPEHTSDAIADPNYKQIGSDFT